MAPRMKLPSKRKGEASSSQARAQNPSSQGSISTSMAGRTVASGRLVDFSFLAKESFVIGRCIANQGWEFLCKTELPIYPSLVREFYQNLIVDGLSGTTVVKGVNIEFDYSLIAIMLKIPPAGVGYDPSGGRAQKIELIFGVDDGVGFDRLSASKLSVEMRLLHHMISRIFIPRSGSFDTITERDLELMYHIISEVRFGLPELVLSVMKDAVSRHRGILPYGMWLTHIFKHFGINLKNEEKTKLIHADRYNADTLRRMGCVKVEGNWIKARDKEEEEEEAAPEPNVSHSDEPSIPPPNPPQIDPSFQPWRQQDQRMPVELSDDQIHRIAREVASIVSSQSSGGSNSSSSDYAMVPHISSFHQELSEMRMKLSELEHNVFIIKGQMMNQSMGRDSQSNKQIEALSKEIQDLKASHLKSSKVLETAMESCHAMMCHINRQFVPICFDTPPSNFQAPPPQPPPPGTSYEHVFPQPSGSVPPRAPPPHLRRRRNERGEGSSSQPSVVIPDED